MKEKTVNIIAGTLILLALSVCVGYLSAFVGGLEILIPYSITLLMWAWTFYYIVLEAVKE